MAIFMDMKLVRLTPKLSCVALACQAEGHARLCHVSYSALLGSFLVDVSAVSHFDHDDNKLSVCDRIDNSEAALADSVFLFPSQFLTPRRPRFRSQTLNPLYDAGAVLLREGFDLRQVFFLLFVQGIIGIGTHFLPSFPASIVTCEVSSRAA